MNLRDMSVKSKLSLSFALLAVIVLLVSALAVRALSIEHAEFSSYVSQAGKRLTLANDVLDAANARAIAARNLVLVTDAAGRDLERAAVVRAHQKVGDSLKALKDSLAASADVEAAQQRSFADVEAVESRYGPVALAIVELALAGKRDEAIARMNADCRPLLAALLTAASQYIETESGRATRQLVAADASYSLNRAVMISASVLAVVLAAVLSMVITGLITRPIDEAVKVARTVASGNLGSQIDDQRRDEPGQLLAALKSMNDSLVEIVTNVRLSGESIADGSAQIASGNGDLSQRTERQAASLQQTAASMAQMTEAVRDSADAARLAAEMAAGASEAASRGGRAVSDVIQKMAGISESSRRIGDIISVIDGIAFQTNILALNAAVEAARAGEQGRGFAVVASEVRSLAQRSSTAAREIRTLIGSSVEQVDAGSRLAGDAGNTMQEAVERAVKVAELIAGLSATTRTQTEGISQVNQAVADLDMATQQNAALVEQSAAAADSLKQQAARLRDIVGFFGLERQPDRVGA